MAKTKLSDIAGKLEVSVSLVSFVMSGKWKENRISEKLAQKVLEVAQEMNYQPNVAARALRTGKSNLIGVVVADISNDFYGKIVREIENEASNNNFQLMFASSDEKLSKFKKSVETLINRQVDGLIIVPVKGSESYLKKKKKQGIPIVLIDRNLEKTNIPYVVDDSFFGGKQLTHLLIKNLKGKLSVVVLDGELSNYNERVNAFIEVLKESDILVDENTILEIPPNDSENTLEKKILESVKKGVKGFFFTQNKLGIEGFKIFKKNGIKIPEDVEVVSYDNPDVFNLATPSITCYQQSINEMASHSIRIIKEMIEDPKVQPKNVKLKGKLIKRESTKS